MFSRRNLTGLLWALALLLAREAVAQEEAPVREPSRPAMGAGYFMIGLRWLDMGPLSDRLEAAGYSAAGRRFLSLGGGGHSMAGRWLLGGEGHGLSERGGESRRGDLRARISAGYGLFRVGYLLLERQNLSVYPLAGIGGAGMSLSISREQDVTFDDVLTDPLCEVTLSRGGLILDAGVGAEFRIPVSGDEREGGFLLLGVRGGYLFFIPLMGDWQMAGGKVTGAPDLGLSGPGLQLLVGFGGWEAKP
ncbi:MAG: hypothetical protein JXB05_10810 [Myxococcaceae bacterium]|nr:hypothetical protein [Myxococcaceae bacterium]